MKKFLAALLSAALFLTLTAGLAPSADAQVQHPFSDVPPYLTAAVNYVYENQYMSGYNDGTFRPDANIKRAQVANALWRRVGSPAVTTGDCPAEWNDVLGNWAEEAICWMIEEGIATGFSDGTWRPNDNINRAQMSVWFYKVFAEGEFYTPGTCSYAGSGPEFTDIPSNYWARNEICVLVAGGIFTGYSDNTFRPAVNLTRGQFASALYKFINVDPRV